MGIVKYLENKVSNVGQALKDGWDKTWEGEESLIGLTLQDRKNIDHQVTIENADWFCGTLRVWFKEGGWLCFDHAIEQFKCIN